MKKAVETIALRIHKSAMAKNLAEIRVAYLQIRSALDQLGALIEQQMLANGPPQPAKQTTRHLCQQILEECGPMDIYRLFQEMELRGFRSKGKDPLGTVRSFLYRVDDFRCQNGIFRLAHQPAPPSSLKPTKRQVCAEILAERGPLEIDQILMEMRRRGYPLRGTNPKNVVRTFLYKDKGFSCAKKLFSLRTADAETDETGKQPLASSTPTRKTTT